MEKISDETYYHVTSIFKPFAARGFDNFEDAQKYAYAMLGLGCPRVEICIRREIIIEGRFRPPKKDKQPVGCGYGPASD